MDKFENSHRFHFFLSSEVIIIAKLPRLRFESETRERKNRSEISRSSRRNSWSNFIGLLLAQGRILCYVARVQNASRCFPPLVPSSLSSSAETTSRMFVGPSFPRGLLLLSLALDGGPMVQMRIFESAKKIIRRIGNSSPSLLFIGRVISKRDAESRLITFPSIDIVMGRSLRRNRRNPVGAFAASATSLLPAML